MRKSLSLAALVLAVGLSGCESVRDDGARLPEGASVYRTHLGQPIARGEIRVESSDPSTVGPEFSQEEAAVGRELARLGWTVLPTKGTTEQVAVVRVNRSELQDRTVTELRVRIQRRSDATVAWEGRAQMEARPNAASATRALAVDRLAEVLFRDFPGESGRTIRAR